MDYVNTILPNTMGSTMMISVINDEQRKIFKYMAGTALASFTTLEDQFSYALPSNCKMDQIKQVLVTDSTGAVSSTSYFNNYEFAGLDDEMSGGSFYYDAFGKIGLYPVPDKTGYSGRVIYDKRPVFFSSTNDAAVEFAIDEDWIDVIKFRTMARVAKSGNYPDIELGNNYDREANEVEAKLKMDWYKKKSKLPKERWSYQEDWSR
jgi:hypothetical protein